jgi:hypothetical protein
MANKQNEYKKLRSYLNKSIRGKNTDAILKSIATGPVHLINNIEAVNDSLYVVSAKEKFLDQKLGDKGVVRPGEVGLSDEVFREIGIEITNRKQVRDLIQQLLRIFYGETFTRATSPSFGPQPYNLEDGDNLIISFDDSEPVQVVFSSSQFQNINAATAQEVADAITKSIRKSGKTGSAFSREENNTEKVILISSTDGPASGIKVLGGKAQNVLKFEELRLTSANATTQWTFSLQTGGKVKLIWTGGPDPSLGRVKINDYVNIYGSAFSSLNRGTFSITAVQGGSLGNAYIEFENPVGVNQTTLQGTSDAILFFYPKKRILTTNKNYAALFQTSPRTIELFMPATTRVVRRSRKGAAHIYGDNSLSLPDQNGPYIYDETISYTIDNRSTFTTESLNINSDSILFVNDSSEFPDEPGHVMLDFGTSRQEGPVPYISRPSSSTIRINPSYKFKKNHPLNCDVTLISKLAPPVLEKDASDLQFFLTDSVVGRIYAEKLIREIKATGINIVVYILYPDDIGLGNYYKDSSLSEKYYIWGTEKDL